MHETPVLPPAPVHPEGGAHPLHQTGEPLDDDELADLVAQVRASAVRLATEALAEIEHVADVDLFMTACAEMVKPGGLACAGLQLGWRTGRLFL